jgi:hypothetical protein
MWLSISNVKIIIYKNLIEKKTTKYSIKSYIGNYWWGGVIIFDNNYNLLNL